MTSLCWDIEEMIESPTRLHVMWGNIPKEGTLTKRSKMEKSDGKTKTL